MGSLVLGMASSGVFFLAALLMELSIASAFLAQSAGGIAMTLVFAVVRAQAVVAWQGASAEQTAGAETG
ncbi:hypothetical protein [uncultured Albimonas sp.]|uniref:hypothetical protein n=1 Tax=uncultured Albimonas sp. TaxID=1331701 RepID=UPI0030EBD472